MIALITAGEAHRYSVLRLYEAAVRRSGFDPSLVRRSGAILYYGLFQFHRTQWDETLLSMGYKIAQVRATDILDIPTQANAAAFLFSNNQSLRGL